MQAFGGGSNCPSSLVHAAAVQARAAKTKVACETSLSPDERAAPRTPCEAPPLPDFLR